MSDEEDNPLDNVKQQLEESENQQEEQEGQDTQKPIPEEEEQEEDGHGPPFPFSEAHQRPLYPHEDTWTEWEDAKFEAEATLRKNGVRDPYGREFDDALLQMGIENPDLLAEYVLQARGLELEDEESQ